jgi:Tol biopolymer transport system component
VSPANNGSFGSPDWSPNGKRIVFDGFFDAYQVFYYDVGVYTVAPDGRHKRFLVEFGDNSPFGEGDPVYSPDGTQIAYSLRGLWRMNPDGTGQTLVTPPGVSAEHPSWQPLP